MLSSIELDDFGKEAMVVSLRNCKEPCEDIKDLQPYNRRTKGEVHVAGVGVFPSIELDDFDKEVAIDSIEIAINFLKTRNVWDCTQIN